MKFIVVIFIINFSIITYAMALHGRNVVEASSFMDTLPAVASTDSIQMFELDEIIVTATRYAQNKFTSARSMTVASGRRLTERNHLSSLDALNDKIGVWIEKRTTTASDPVIRGVSGANIMSMVNGNTLSTFWGEGGFAGDDMYGKVDPASIERIEIVRGPASVIYGSNALGGVVNFITKTAPLGFTDGHFQAGGRVKGTFSSVSNYGMGRLETWGASDNVRYFFGSSAQKGGNMRAGGNTGIIVPSGGKALAFDLHGEMRVKTNHYISLTSQYMNRPESYKSFRPKQLNKNERMGLQLGYRINEQTRLYDNIQMTLYHQYKEDKRIWYTDTDLKTTEKEGYALWRTYTADVHASKTTGNRNLLLYGAGYQRDVAESPDDEQFTITTLQGNQQAAPETSWGNLGFYLHNEWKPVQLLTLSAGIRFDHFLLIARDNLFYTKPGDLDTLQNRAITDPGRFEKNALTASAAAVLHLHRQMNLALTWARGFRMFPPSFGIRQTGFGVLTPNGLLDPVVADMFEISPRLRTTSLVMNLTAYYTRFRNFQQPVMGEFNGKEYIDYNNNGIFEPDEKVYVNAANGDAYVTGIEVEFDLRLAALSDALSGFHLIGGGMVNYGRMQFPGIDEVPLRHTHPARIIAKLRYDHSFIRSRAWFEMSADMVGRYDQIETSRLHSDVGYLENPQDPGSGLYREYGLPAYSVFDARGGVAFNNKIILTLGLENMFDIRYRTAHSRMDAPGRNILLGLEFAIGSSSQ